MEVVTTPTGRTRLSPEERRTQLLDLGVELLATRAIDEISIDLLAEQAGISRGLLYHYFGGKHAFREAVVRRAVDDLVAQTAPPAEGDALERLHASMAVYVDYVVANHAGYRSLVKAAAGGSEDLRALHEEARAALTDRIFREDTDNLMPDTPVTRLVVRGWSAMTEELVLTWVADPRGMTREQLIALLADSLPALVGVGEGPAGARGAGT
jgi:AcrR family transcriptional regulator